MTRLSSIMVAALPLCMSQLVPPPNVQYTGFGYNLLEGNPHSTETGVDNGWKRQIFEMSYEDGHTVFLKDNEEFLQPDNVSLAAAISCVSGFKSRTHTTAKSYTNSLSVSANADFSGWGAAFKASGDYKEVEEGSFKGGLIYVETDYKCETYDTRVELFTPLHPDFIYTVGTLSSSYDETELFAFIELFGTHYAMRTSMGGVYGRRYTFTHSAYETLKEQSVSVEAKASYQSMTVSGSASVLTEEQSQQAEAVANAQTSSEEYWYGGDTDTAFSSTHDLDDWSSTISGSPLPVSWDLEPISDLLVSRYFPNDVNIATKKANLAAALLNYCTHLEGEGIIDCDELVQGDRTLQTSSQCFEPLANEVYDEVVSLDSSYDFYFNYEYVSFDDCLAKCCEGDCANAEDGVLLHGCRNRCNRVPIDVDYRVLPDVDVAPNTATHVADAAVGISRDACHALCEGLSRCRIAIFAPSSGTCWPLGGYGNFVERSDREVLYSIDEGFTVRDSCPGEGATHSRSCRVRTDKAGVRCCDGMGGCNAQCDGYNGIHDYGQAAAYCKWIGMHLCNEFELQGGHCCDHNANDNWCSDVAVWLGDDDGQFIQTAVCPLPQTPPNTTVEFREVFRFAADRLAPDTGVNSRNLAVFTYTDPANGVNVLRVFAGEAGDRYCDAPMYYGMQEVHIETTGRTYTVNINGAEACTFDIQNGGDDVPSTQMITTNNHPAAQGLVCNALLFNKITVPMWYPFNDAIVTIYALHSRKPMSLLNNDRSEGQRIVQNEWSESDTAQAWKLVKSTNTNFLDAYQIKLNDASGNCVSLGDVLGLRGALLVLKPCNSALQQLWRFVEATGSYNIQSVMNPVHYVDVSGQSTANNEKIHMWSKTGAANQEWFFREL